jgi:hypothetical protein
MGSPRKSALNKFQWYVIKTNREKMASSLARQKKIPHPSLSD